VVVASLGWRGLFALLAALTAVAALIILLAVPDMRAKPKPSRERQTVCLSTIYRDPRFWRLAPLSTLGIGTAWSLQGLWAAPWLKDVAGFDRATVVQHLGVMAIALSISALLLGAAADRLRRIGVRTEVVLASTLALSMTAQLALLLGCPLPSHLIWAVIAGAGAATVLSYAILASYFPREASGRANGALNLLHMGGTFLLQCATGFIIEQWPQTGGRYPVEAHQAALAIGLALQLAALLWFAVPRQRTVLSIERAVARMTLLAQARPARASLQYAASVTSRSAHFALAQRDAVRWRRAAAASASISAALPTLFTLPAARSEGQPDVLEDALRDRVGADQPRARPAWGHFSPSGTAEAELPKWRLPDESGARP
jgi:MFS family permease